MILQSFQDIRPSIRLNFEHNVRLKPFFAINFECMIHDWIFNLPYKCMHIFFYVECMNTFDFSTIDVKIVRCVILVCYLFDTINVAANRTKSFTQPRIKWPRLVKTAKTCGKLCTYTLGRSRSNTHICHNTCRKKAMQRNVFWLRTMFFCVRLFCMRYC